MAGEQLQKKKTLVEIAGFPPPIGAINTRISFIAHEWEAKGNKILLVNIGPSRKLNNTKYINVQGAFHFIMYVWRASARGYTIHTHTNAKGIKGTLLALSAQLISIWFGRHCVLTFHAGHQQHYFPKTNKPWLDILMRSVFLTPRHIICNNAKVKELIVRDYGINEDKVHPIPAFCAEYVKAKFDTLPPPVASFTESHDPILVSYVFFFHPEFTVDLMIKAVKRLREDYPRLGLIIMGCTQFAESYIPLVEELGLVQHILLAGNLPRPQFLGLLQRGTLYLRTPMGDGVCSSVLEALSLGTPVVASDNGTRPPSCILYQGGDLDDMVDKIRYVLQNREEVAAQIVRPSEDNTLKKEVELLLSV